MYPLEEKKERVQFKLLEPSKLAINTVNCHYEKFFKNSECVIISEDKKLIKRKIKGNEKIKSKINNIIYGTRFIY